MAAGYGLFSVAETGEREEPPSGHHICHMPRYAAESKECNGMTESQQSDSPVYECLNGWFEVEGDIDDFIFYVERPNQSEK